jgi:DNA-binding CsgD family transcriptional regulator
VGSPDLEAGFAALRAGEPAVARRAFERAVAGAESGRALEGLAESMYLDREYGDAAVRYEQAYVAYRREGAVAAAGRAARTVGWIAGNVLGDWAVRNGWLARAHSVLQEAGPHGPEHGWVLIIDAFREPDPGRRESGLREAIAIGHRCADADVEFLARGYLGGLYVMMDRVDEGLTLSDEALAAVSAGELTELATIDEIYCGLFWACELVNDVGRADQWMRMGAERIRRSNVVAAFCRAHYGGILTAAGRWTEAETELVEAVGNFAAGMPVRRSAALIRLAKLRLLQGRLDEAAELLRGLDWHPDAVGPLAALHLARGETALARELLERRTAAADDGVPTVGESTMVGPLLALLVDVHLERGEVEPAGRVAERLARLAHAQRAPYLRAATALAAGRVRLAAGHADAHVDLQQALVGFGRAGLPLEAARSRLELARALAGHEPQTAVAAARAALSEFERLRAARHADEAAALLRSLGQPVRLTGRGAGALSRRESEVLELVGAGLSNVEIAARLFISRRTVEHHVASVLAKLGLRNRAEAVAYLLRENVRR